jgi:hypothetical protein
VVAGAVVHSDATRASSNDDQERADGQRDPPVRQAKEAARAAAMEQFISAYAEDANQMELRIKQTTLRELLSYELFPDTNETSVLLFERFRQKYLAGLEAMLADVRAGSPPTDNEIEAALASARTSLQQREGSGAYIATGMRGVVPTGPLSSAGYAQQHPTHDRDGQKIVDKMPWIKPGAAVYAGLTDRTAIRTGASEIWVGRPIATAGGRWAWISRRYGRQSREREGSAIRPPRSNGL